MHAQVHDSSDEVRFQAGLFFCVCPSGTELTLPEKKIYAEMCPGAFLLFGRNCQTARQVRNLTDEIRDIAGKNTLIAIDQEGGPVDRLRSFLPPMPSAEHLAMADDSEIFQKAGILTGKILSHLGINFNLAPVVDVPHCTEAVNGLSKRYPGKTVTSICANARAYLAGLQSQGVTGCLKHFPGLGGADTDPHHQFPVVRRTKAQIEEEDLAPFLHLIAQAEVRAVMTGHAAYPSLPENVNVPVPASLSSGIVSHLLRDRMKFTGLTLSDDLRMGAVIQSAGSLTSAAIQAFAAGNDLLLVCAEAEEIAHVLENFIRHFQQKKEWRERFQTSARRIREVSSALPCPPALRDDVFPALAQEIQALSEELAVKITRSTINQISISENNIYQETVHQ
jgi:beta-N-acetylhexosaminidase